PLVIGSRSSIFAPFQNLGLIVMDEVHDESFHQDSTPRYRTLELASWIVQHLGIQLIATSATPSVLQYFVSRQSPHWQLHTLGSRAGNASLAQTTVVDMKRAPRISKGSIISQPLFDAIEASL
ncbi:MAG: primosomal protein N', partial [Patescibacteria group bacterium]|nr:primosomal protein N' [Patescibacteria group bacterium]